MPDSEFLTAALGYLRAKWSIFPTIGKTPLTKTGFKEATQDEAQIREWASLYPEANIGIATGASNLVVLDADVKSGGIESLAALCKEIPELKNTWIAKTGGGGYHLYFQSREDMPLTNSASKLGPGLDIRGIGGYVVAPPSGHASGNKYEWSKSPKLVPGLKLALVPIELVDRIHTAGFAGSASTVFESEEPIETRHATLAQLAGALRRKGLGVDEIAAALNVIDQKRCRPTPLGPDEVQRIATNIGTKPTTEHIGNVHTQDDPRAGKKKLELIRYDKIIKEEIGWLWHGRIAYGKFGLLVGVQGKTKSYLSLAITAAVTTGTPLPDDYVNLKPVPASVLLITFEDGEGDTIKPRLEKVGADMERVYTIEMSQAAFTVDDIPALEATLDDHPDIKLVIIDPVQSMMGNVDDRNDTKTRNALNPLVRAAKMRGIAVLGIKHLNKDESKTLDNRIGGSVAYAGLARYILLAGYDNEKPFGPHGEVYAGVMAIKGNLSGQATPIAYEVNDRGLLFLGTDRALTPERLLPLPPNRKKKDD